jgi:hypothetical protein
MLLRYEQLCATMPALLVKTAESLLPAELALRGGLVMCRLLLKQWSKYVLMSVCKGQLKCVL